MAAAGGSWTGSRRSSGVTVEKKWCKKHSTYIIIEKARKLAGGEGV